MGEMTPEITPIFTVGEMRAPPPAAEARSGRATGRMTGRVTGRMTGEVAGEIGETGEITPRLLETREASSLPTL